ncbi:MAG TPA: replication factor C large subunit [Candidatus Pacearchaeota archaeon]|nr:ATP-dependent zinc metalloprotease FtsH [archaeon BMS3Abin17]HDK42735.1 replication factor C large subunit [Candidatus Pacearchaeota archaeon]HDZ61294.1 replication factor C large subunit [Candidatus Pacearchaeota archaeon]
MTWTEKYRPNYYEDIKGQDEAVKKIKEFIINFKSGKKALMLHGPPGTGKTTLAHVTARESESEIFELNASDLRNKNKLQEILKPAIEQKSLLQQGKIILVDEVDGISAVDRGGLGELLSLIDSSEYPVIITANDIWNKKLNPLRKKAELVQLKEISYNLVKDMMIHILRKEKLFIDNEILTKIAINAKGDLRAAINDLQTISRTEHPSLIGLDERNKETDIFNALKLVFKGKPTKETLNVFNSVNMNMDELILWVEENIPSEYQGEELAKAYDALSKVDVFKGRIYKQQYWRFLVYENILLSYGISASKKDIKTGFTSYKKPTRILKIWLNNQRTAKKKSISQKYARYVHVGHKRAMNEFPIIRNILKNPDIRQELRLTEEEIAYLDKPLT